MNKEELKQEAEGYFKSICGDYNEEYERTGKRHYFVGFDIKNAYLAGAEPREKRIEELEEKISVLLSCKNCPENKGGFICAKEYEGKCLAQKIEYIKELQKENAELKKKNLDIQDAVTMQMYTNKANKEIADRQLTNAKELLKNILAISVHDKRQCTYDAYILTVKEAEQFLKDSEVEK